MRQKTRPMKDKGVIISNENFTLMWHTDFEELVMVFKKTTPVSIEGRGCMQNGTYPFRDYQEDYLYHLWPQM